MLFCPNKHYFMCGSNMLFCPNKHYLTRVEVSCCFVLINIILCVWKYHIASKQAHKQGTCAMGNGLSSVASETILVVSVLA